jgi:alkaline phosphatase isozyme conversion protein
MIRIDWLHKAIGLGLVLSILVGCGAPTATPVPATATPVPATATAVTVPTAREHLVALSETIGPRVAGSANETEAARYIETVLRDAGYAPLIQPFTFSAVITDVGVTLESANVLATKAGLSTQEIIVGAHYDSVEVGRGADDNASGVAVMLEVATRLKDVQTPYTIKFVAFGAEELDRQGSRYYAGEMTAADVDNTVAMINLDSLIAGDMTYVYGDAGEKGFLRDWLLDMAHKEGLDLRTQTGENPIYPAGTTGDWSDHAPFQTRGVPYAYFEATNWGLGARDGYTQVDERLGVGGEIWHTKYDNLAYIDETFPGRVDQHLELFVTALFNALTQFKIPD